ncbi:cytochrome P450 [Mycena galopus ATCC 62051]|nr:cytochrome P450 [Mycena galopus ATCC 62051]
MISPILFLVASAILSWALIYLLRFLHREFTYPLAAVAGPKNRSFIFGNIQQTENDPDQTKKWQEQFGPIYRFRGLFGMRHLYVADVKGLSHIVANDSQYERPPAVVGFRKRLMGHGILSVEGADHQRQRRILLQAFGAPQIRLVTQIFVDKAVQLRDIWAVELGKETGVLAGRVDVFDGLRRMTLDVIGQAGFNYDFNALDPPAGSPDSDLNEAFGRVFHSPDARSTILFTMIEGLIPALKLVPFWPGRKAVVNAHDAMIDISSQIVSESTSEILADGEKSLGSKKDLISVLLQANMSTSLPERQRLSNAEVIAQIPAFLLAGHETTSGSTAWALHALSLKPAIQTKLREELFTLSSENPTMEELNSLPYLEKVVREVLRVHGPVAYIERIATKDDVLPLSRPYVDETGKSHETLLIPKGQIIYMPILAFNKDPLVWGPDAEEFKPERWEHVPSGAGAIPAVPHPNLFSFFAGQTSCIGYKFSLVEMKALLFFLVRAFEFKPAVPDGGIGRTSGLVHRPLDLAEPNKGSTLPLILKPFITPDE